MTDTDAPEWPDPADKAHAVEQAKQLRDQAAKGGLRFEAYLPPSLALWLLDLIEQDTFLDPSEAVFVILGEHKELAPHADLRRELLKRRIQVAADDSRPGISMEEMKALLREKREAPPARAGQMGKAVPALTHRGFSLAALRSLRRYVGARSLRAGAGCSPASLNQATPATLAPGRPALII